MDNERYATGFLYKRLWGLLDELHKIYKNKGNRGEIGIRTIQIYTTIAI